MLLLKNDSQDLLSAALESNIKEDRTDLDLLFGCLLSSGDCPSRGRTLPRRNQRLRRTHLQRRRLDSLLRRKRAGQTLSRPSPSRKPLRAVFRDSSFASSPSEKINVTEVFKLLSAGHEE
jgi:adenine-specific DNA-methyltransferase